MIMDLLKAFNTMNHELLTTKSGAYEFQKKCTFFQEKLFNE